MSTHQSDEFQPDLDLACTLVGAKYMTGPDAKAWVPSPLGGETKQELVMIPGILTHPVLHARAPPCAPMRRSELIETV